MHVEERRLAGPVRSDQGRDRALAYLHRRAVDGADAAESLDHAIGLEDRAVRADRPALVAVAVASVTEDHLLPLAEHPLRPERHQPNQHQAHDDEPQGRDLGLRTSGRSRKRRPLEDRPEDDRARLRRPSSCASPPRISTRIADEGDDRLNSSGTTNLRLRARKKPAIAPSVAAIASDWSLYENAFLPSALAASSSSRIARSTRPQGVR